MIRVRTQAALNSANRRQLGNGVVLTTAQRCAAVLDSGRRTLIHDVPVHHRAGRRGRLVLLRADFPARRHHVRRVCRPVDEPIPLDAPKTFSPNTTVADQPAQLCPGPPILWIPDFRGLYNLWTYGLGQEMTTPIAEQFQWVGDLAQPSTWANP